MFSCSIRTLVRSIKRIRFLETGFKTFSMENTLKSAILKLVGRGLGDVRQGLSVLTDAEFGNEEILNIAFDVLKNNELIAVPTDTVYGLAGLAQSPTAITKLYNLKKRDPLKPVAICLGDINDISKWCHVRVPIELLSELLPGPVTLVFQRRSSLNPDLNPETNLVGIRIPQSRFICDLARRCNEPLALTSANISLQTSTLEVQEFENLWSKLGLVIDGGPLGEVDPDRLGSTVVDLSNYGEYTILRPGCASKQTRILLEKYNLKNR